MVIDREGLDLLGFLSLNTRDDLPVSSAQRRLSGVSKRQHHKSGSAVETGSVLRKANRKVGCYQTMRTTLGRNALARGYRGCKAVIGRREGGPLVVSRSGYRTADN